MNQPTLFDQPVTNRRHAIMKAARDQIRQHLADGNAQFSVTVEDREYVIQVQPSGTTTCNGRYVADSPSVSAILYFIHRDWWNYYDYPGKSFRKS